MTDTLQEEIPLSIAAQRLRRSWFLTRELVLRGDLDGRLRDGRWVVTAESLEAYAARCTPDDAA